MNFLVFFTGCRTQECRYRRIFNDGHHSPFQLAMTDHQSTGLAAKNNFTTRLTNDRHCFRSITRVSLPAEPCIFAIAVLGKLSEFEQI